MLFSNKDVNYLDRSLDNAYDMKCPSRYRYSTITIGRGLCGKGNHSLGAKRPYFAISSVEPAVDHTFS